MLITEVRIYRSPGTNEKLLAFAQVTLDGAFVVRDIRIIQSPKGIFVSMPTRKLTRPCCFCREKNEVLARFCTQCGKALPVVSSGPSEPRLKVFADVAHPITTSCRAQMEAAILLAYRQEMGQP